MTPDERQRRRHQLLAALVVTHLEPSPGGLAACRSALRGWLDSWAGVGRVAMGMARQGADLPLTRYGHEGWRATFFPAGRAHSVVLSSAWAATPWAAVQAAARAALVADRVA